MKVISRTEAKALNLKRYFTGKPCKRGHLVERLLCNRKCCVCNNWAAMVWGKDNPTKRTAAVRKWQKVNPTYARDNNKTFLGHLQKTYHGMRSRVSGQVKQSEHLYKGLGLMSSKEFLAWAKSDKKYLALYEAWVRSAYERRLCPSIDRIDTLRGYVPGNVQWLTAADNTRKAVLWRYYGINQTTKEAA